MCIHRCSKGLEIHFTVFNTFLPKLLFTGYILPREDILITVAIMCESDFCKCIIHRPCLKCWDLVCKQLMMNLTHHKRYITMDQKISERDSSFLSLSLYANKALYFAPQFFFVKIEIVCKHHYYSC